MTNIYLLKLKEWGYEESDSFVVIAKNNEEAIKLCGIYDTKEEANKHFNSNCFRDNIKEIKLIGTTINSEEKSVIVLDSFNAG